MCIYSNIPIAMLLVFLFGQKKNCHTVTWLEFEQNVLNECGMPYIWNTQTFINCIWIVKTVKFSL